MPGSALSKDILKHVRALGVPGSRGFNKTY